MKFLWLPADQLGALAGYNVDEANGIQSVLPMHDYECVDLVVEIQILAQQAPHRNWTSVRARTIGVVAESLDVADDVSFGGKDAFERGARRHCGVVIDRSNPLAQSYRRPGRESWTQMVTGNSHRAGKSLHARALVFAVLRQAK